LRPGVRLLTLTGAGGSGKTRLALEAARGLPASFVDGVVFVDLAPHRNPAQVVPAIAGALRIDAATERALIDRLGGVLASRRLLLLLDNFEHVLPAAPRIAELLAGCPDLKVLATSRSRLRLRWEQVFPVWPLAVPESSQAADPVGLAHVPAVALFVERAMAADPDFQLTADNAAAIVEICRRLDGLPLALELAAARTPLIPPAALAARLDRSLPLLADGPRDLPARQQTLRATLEWSHDLLGARERRLFRRLAAFVDGVGLDQILAVGRDDAEGVSDVLDGLGALLDQNLVYRETTPEGDARLRMLETIGEFAREQLAASGEEETRRRRHALAYVALAEAGGPELDGPAARGPGPPDMGPSPGARPRESALRARLAGRPGRGRVELPSGRGAHLVLVPAGQGARGAGLGGAGAAVRGADGAIDCARPGAIHRRPAGLQPGRGGPGPASPRGSGGTVPGTG
jgi:predicted ATPase